MTDTGGNSIPDVWSVVRGEAEYSSAEEALENLVQLKDVEFSEIFNDRETELESEDSEGISIKFRHSDKSNWLSLSTDSDHQLQVGLSLVDDNIQDFESVLSEILKRIPPLTLNNTTAVKKYDLNFRSLNLPIREDWEPEITGIRLKYWGVDFIVQASVNDDDTIRVTATRDLNLELEGKIEENVLEETIRESDRLVEEVL